MESMSLVDAALNELGMLSSVTDSRKDYLNEQAAARRRSSSYNVLQLNPTYVTCLGPVSHPEKARSKHTNVEEAPKSLRASSSVPQLVTTENRVCRRQRSKPRYSRPYHIPKQYAAVTRSRRTTEPSEEKESMVQPSGKSGTDDASINLDLTSDNDVVPTIHCLTRSKSVDDVRRVTFQAASSVQVTSQYQEMEMVSRHLRDLQVSSQ